MTVNRSILHNIIAINICSSMWTDQSQKKYEMTIELMQYYKCVLRIGLYKHLGAAIGLDLYSAGPFGDASKI
jgi:hypothetical protein